MNLGAIAVTPHSLASDAAFTILSRGGNAVDAAIAANAVLGVVLPTTCGPGGDLFALVHAPGMAAPAALNASGRAGAGADAGKLRAARYERVPLRGPLSVTVPGCVDGWEALLSRFGAFTMEQVLRPAVVLADTGFEVSAELSSALGRIHGLISGQTAAKRLYPDEAVPAPGAVIRRPGLAATLKTLALGGRKAFYGGRVGAAISEATGDVITSEDLARNQAMWVDPIGLEVFGLQAWTMPPNSQGYLTLAAARLFAELAPPADPTDPAYHHALIEAYRAVAWERDDVVADPASAPLSPERLLDPERLLGRLNHFDPERAGTWPAPVPVTGGTAYLCVRDQAGMGVSLIQSNFHGIGSGLGAGDTGVFLHNRGAGFSLVAGHPNEMKPGKRPLHTLSPTLWTDGERLAALLGTRGGDHQPQLLVQMAAHLFYAGLSPDAAQDLPRWTLEAFGPGAPSRVAVERSFPEDVAVGLRRRGHEVTATEHDRMVGWGPVSVIRVDGDGAVVGAADPRVTTAAVAP